MLNYKDFIKEGKHGKYEIWGKKGNKDQVLDYASDENAVNDIKKEWEKKGWKTYIKESLSENLSTVGDNLTPDEIEEKWTQILDIWSEDDIIESIDEKVFDFIPNDWEDEYEDEYEAYQECGRGEAESATIDEVLNSVGVEYNDELYDKIKDHFSINTN